MNRDRRERGGRRREGERESKLNINLNYYLAEKISHKNKHERQDSN